MQSHRCVSGDRRTQSTQSTGCTRTRRMTQVAEILDYQIDQSEYRVGISNTVAQNALSKGEQIISTKQVEVFEVGSIRESTICRLYFSFYQSISEFRKSRSDCTITMAAVGRLGNVSTVFLWKVNIHLNAVAKKFKCGKHSCFVNLHLSKTFEERSIILLSSCFIQVIHQD